jgi:glycosyltransferase involved in cell wall biosynthesis
MSHRQPDPSERTPLIVVGPVPPPVHGVTVSTTLVLGNPLLQERFALRHVDTSDHRDAENIDRWDFENVRSGIAATLRMLRHTRGRKGIVYLPLSGGTPGLMRDSLLIFAARLRRWPVTGHLRGGEFHHYFWALPKPIAWYVRLVLMRLTSIAAMGESLTHMFDGIVPANRIAVITNGTPDAGPPSTDRDLETVLFLSGLRRRKGVYEALEAARIVLEQRPTARFLFAGWFQDEQVEKELRAIAAPLGDAVEFTGEADPEQKDALMRRASVLLFPPVETEGHPRVVLEGIAAGLPIVTTDQGAIKETVVDGESAFVLDTADPHQIADRILLLLGDPALRERMGAAARARFESEFTQARADEKIADWLTAVATARGLKMPRGG